MSAQGEIDFEFARARADLGIERSARKAERVTAPGWVDRAAEAVREYAGVDFAGPDEKFTIEAARLWVERSKKLPAPPDGRAWGAVTRRCITLGIIEEAGGYAPAASSNGSPKRLYRRGKKL